MLRNFISYIFSIINTRDIVLIVLFMLLIILRPYIKRKRKKFDTEVTYLQELSHEFSFDKYERNKLLLNILSSKEQNIQNITNSYKGFKKQSQNFYMLILVGLISYFNTHNYIEIFCLTGFVMIVMYLLDIHFEDTIDRQEYTREVTNRSISNLLFGENMYAKYYAISYKEFDSYWDKLAERNPRWHRKIIRGLLPDSVQIVYYIIPGILLYILARAKEII